jgi:DNA-binding PadR family transcriptional regulator
MRVLFLVRVDLGREGCDPSEPSDEAGSLLGDMRQFRELGADSLLQGELLICLARREATIGDLVRDIFDPGEESYSKAKYMRVMRALNALEAKGFVARALFGKEKPYRLTRYGRENIETILGGQSPELLLTRGSLAIYLGAAVMVALSMVATIYRSPSEVLVAVWLLSGVLLGVSITRFVKTLRVIM